MEDSIVEYWMPEECAAGLCAPDDIGKVKSPLIEARKLAQRATIKAVKALVEVAEQNEDLNAKVKAATALMDRGWGKPDQHVSTDNVHRIDEMPWLSAQRHAYQLGADAAKLIESGLAITDATPKGESSAELDHAAPALPEAGRSGFPGE